METEQSEKRVRKRYKHLFKQIKNQMEFYFSDSNLLKDRYVKKLMDENEDKWVPLEVFKNFNKLRNITEDMSLVAKALASSELLEVNETKDKIRRTKPIADPGDLDARTIYVEKLPAKVTHDWVKNVFSAFGTVTYVSLPRFQSTGDFKGFGFVEFQDEEEAKRAVREYSTPSADNTKKAGIFPTGSKQMKQAIKQAVANNIPVPNSQTTTKNAKKRKISEDEERAKGAKKSKKEEDIEEEEEESSEGKPESVEKQMTEGNNEEKKEESSEDKLKISKKRKNKERKEDEGEEMSEEKIKSSKKRKNKEKKEEEEEDSSEEKDKSNKKKKTKKGEEGNEESLEEDKKGVKRKHESESDNVSPKKQKTEEPEKKKNRKKKKKYNKTDEESKLKVLSKAEWLELRNEYLQLQKANMKKLKESLRKATSPDDQTQTPTKTEPIETNTTESISEKAKRGLEFIPDVVIEVTSKVPLDRKRIKEVLSEHGEVCYVDIGDDESKAVVRCPTPYNAKKITMAEMSSYHCRLLQGEEETQYWDKIKADREKRLNSKQKKVRGKDRAMNKALQRGPVIETIPKERKKVYFHYP